jgi:hypothetical protein
MRLEEAERLAKRLKRFWRARGYEITTTVTHEKVYERGHLENVYAVRTDMVNGFPRDAEPTAARAWQAR